MQERPTIHDGDLDLYGSKNCGGYWDVDKGI